MSMPAISLYIILYRPVLATLYFKFKFNITIVGLGIKATIPKNVYNIDKVMISV